MLESKQFRRTGNKWICQQWIVSGKKRNIYFDELESIIVGAKDTKIDLTYRERNIWENFKEIKEKGTQKQE